MTAEPMGLPTTMRPRAETQTAAWPAGGYGLFGPSAVIPPLVQILGEARPRFAVYAAAKRSLDIVVAAILLLVLAPLFALIAAAIWLDTGWPVFYLAERVGRHGRSFTVVKFRSMRAGADATPHAEFVRNLMRESLTSIALYKVPGDARVTRVGRWLRCTSLDELPQLWNVLRGEMSLVGPRPDVPYAVVDYADWMHKRLAIRPGITGLWQVSGRSRLSLHEMYRLDVEYAGKASLLLDLEILVRTVPAMLDCGGAA
jgi:lipopolysaccharide/colanic/teichoic acid biosynthesis glycosyltransferase